MDETLNEINETIETPADGQPETPNEPAEEIPEIDIPQEEEEIVEPKDWSEWDKHEFAEGEIFTTEYPPQAAIWCNGSGAYYLKEIEPDEEGNIRYQITKNPEPTEEEIAQRNAMLNLTAADVERGIYKAKGMDFDDIIALVEQYNEAAPLDAVGNSATIDIKALKIELKANNFYYGNPYVKQVGQLLGLTDEQMLEFFKTGDYTKLIAE